MILRASLRHFPAPIDTRQVCQRAIQEIRHLPEVRGFSSFAFLPRSYSTIPPPPPNQSSISASASPSSPIPPPSDLRSQLSSIPTRPTTNNAHPKTRPRRSFRRYIYAATFLCIGMTAGQYLRLLIAPPPLPLAYTPEDDLMVAHLHKKASKFPLVQALSSDPAWTAHDAYSSIPEAERSRRLTTGALAGARALGGYQRIFTNEQTGEMITVVFFGGAMAGWPGVVHGGLSATVLDESLGRCAIRLLEGNTGVTANLDVTYKKPVLSNGWYVVRVRPMTEEEHGVEYKGHARKMWVQGTLEMLDGGVCVTAKGLFVVPKRYETKPLKNI